MCVNPQRRRRDEIALVALLKSCAKHKLLQKGNLLHAHILERGLLHSNIFIGNSLVSMYAKCGAIAEAYHVFDTLSGRDIVSWNILVDGYTQLGCDDLAFGVFDRIHHESLIRNVVTFAGIFKACGNTNSLSKGKRLHACIVADSGNILASDGGKDMDVEISKAGLLGNRECFASVLLDMYAKCGEIEMAQEIFDELTCRDVVSWTALLGGYCRQGLGEEALRCYDQMQEEGTRPDALTFAFALEACGSIGAADLGIGIHAAIARRQLLGKDAVLASALVDMYAKCGALSKAQEVFEEIPVQNMVAWTSLVGGYCDHGYGEKALDCYEKIKHKGLSLDAVTFACLLKTCASIGALEKGTELHAETMRTGLLGTGTVVDGAVLDMYAKCGEITKAHRVFEELTKRDLVSWTILISWYCEEGQGDTALKLFREMQNEGFGGDVVTLCCILKACGTIAAVNLGQEVHAEIVRRQWFRNDTAIDNALLDMYAKCGALSKAQEVFDAAKYRDMVLWTTLITGYCDQAGHAKEASHCFEEMKQEGVSPDILTFVYAFRACGSAQNVKAGSQIHATVAASGLLADNSVLGNALIDMYSKCGELVMARRVFDKMPNRDIVSWNTIISMFNDNGLFEDVLANYELMKYDRVSPDFVTFTSILKACGVLRAIKKVENIHNELIMKGLLEDNLVLENCLIDMYNKCGDISNIQQGLEKFPIQNMVTWKPVQSACSQQNLSKQVINCSNKLRNNESARDIVPFSHNLRGNCSSGTYTWNHFASQISVQPLS